MAAGDSDSESDSEFNKLRSNFNLLNLKLNVLKLTVTADGVTTGCHTVAVAAAQRLLAPVTALFIEELRKRAPAEVPALAALQAALRHPFPELLVHRHDFAG